MRRFNGGGLQDQSFAFQGRYIDLARAKSEALVNIYCLLKQNIESCNAKAWFSLAHKHKHKDIRTRRMVYLSQFSIPDLLNPMISKMADKASAISLLICSHESWVKVTYDWSTALCLVALCLSLCRARFHYSQSLDFPKSPSSDVARLAASWPKKPAPLAKKPP